MRLMRRCLLVLFLVFGSAQASSFNVGVGLTYAGIGAELELSLDDRHALVFGLGGLPVPGAFYLNEVSAGRVFDFALSSAYAGYKYLFTPEAGGFFIVGRFGHYVLDLGGAGGVWLNSPALGVSAGYRFGSDQVNYLDLELGGFAFSEGVSYTFLVNYGFRF